MTNDNLIEVMNEISEKMDEMILLLKRIESNTGSIESNTGDIYYVKSAVEDVESAVKKLKK